MTTGQPEHWLRGPVEGVPPLLQPLAHALLQAVDEMDAALESFPESLLWTRPAGVASVGFHLLHVRGVIDRLFTYARGEALDEEQRRALTIERNGAAEAESVSSLLVAVRGQVERAISQLRRTDVATLTDHRGVGRAGLPSSVLGLLFHATEHTQRHLGQLLVTSRVQVENEG